MYCYSETVKETEIKITLLATMNEMVIFLDLLKLICYMAYFTALVRQIKTCNEINIFIIILH